MLSVKIKLEELKIGASQTASITEKRSSLPVLANVLLEGRDNILTLRATDMESTFVGSFPAEIISEGIITLPSKKFHEVVNSLNGDVVSLEEEDGQTMSLSCGGFNTVMFGLSAEEFPMIPLPESISFITLESQNLINAIDKTIYSVTTTNTRFNLAGIHWVKEESGGNKSLKLISTDSRRMSLATIPTENLDHFELDMETGITISKKGVTELRKLAEYNKTIQVGISVNNLVAKTPSATLLLRLLSSNFPDHNKIFPTGHDKFMMINRRDFIEGLKRLAIMLSENYKIVKFIFSDNLLTLLSINPELGQAQESLKSAYTGPSLTMTFNPFHFLETLSAMKSENIQIALLSEKMPCVITGPEDPGFSEVITIVSP